MDIRACKIEAVFGLAKRFINHGHGYVTLLLEVRNDVRIYSMEVANDTRQTREAQA